MSIPTEERKTLRILAIEPAGFHEKFNAFTPFTHIPIIPEADAKSQNPDYFLVFPWHFRKGIIEKEKEFLNKGGKFIFPLTKIAMVG